MNTKLNDTNKITQETVDLFKELQTALDTSVSTLVPVLRVYLEDIRSIRMAFAGEVKHIIQSTQELSAIAKNAKEIGDLVKSIQELDKVLESGLKDKINATFRSNT